MTDPRSFAVPVVPQRSRALRPLGTCLVVFALSSLVGCGAVVRTGQSDDDILADAGPNADARCVFGCTDFDAPLGEDSATEDASAADGVEGECTTCERDEGMPGEDATPDDALGPDEAEPDAALEDVQEPPADVAPPMDVPVALEDAGGDEGAPIDVANDAPVDVFDAGADAAVDAPVDAATLDVQPDVPFDLGVDVPPDVPPDVPVDVPRDVPVDTGPMLSCSSALEPEQYTFASNTVRLQIGTLPNGTLSTATAWSLSATPPQAPMARSADCVLYQQGGSYGSTARARGFALNHGSAAITGVSMRDGTYQWNPATRQYESIRAALHDFNRVGTPVQLALMGGSDVPSPGTANLLSPHFVPAEMYRPPAAAGWSRTGDNVITWNVPAGTPVTTVALFEFQRFGSSAADFHGIVCAVPACRGRMVVPGSMVSQFARGISVSTVFSIATHAPVLPESRTPAVRFLMTWFVSNNFTLF